MAGIVKNPFVQNGVLNRDYIRMYPTGTDTDPDSYSKYQIGDVEVASQIVRGTMTFNKSKLRELDPSYSGYTHLFVLQMPEFMKALAQGNIIGGASAQKARYHYANLKAILEMGSTSYQGTPDLTLQTADVSVGWSEKNFAVPLYSNYDSTQFSIRCIETYGEPLRHACEYYIKGLADPNAKFQHLHGAASVPNNGTNNKIPMQPSLANITFTIMAIQTDQTLHSIQDISIWSNCIITGVERSHLDWELGSVDIVQPQTVQFRGIYLPHSDAPAVMEKATDLLEKRLHYYKRLEDMTESEYGADQWDEPNEGLPELKN